MRKVKSKFSFCFLALTVIGVLNSCTKPRETVTPADDTADQTQVASDDARVNSELENVTVDANTALSASTLSSGRLSSLDSAGVINLPCDVTLDTTQYKSGIWTLTYSGSSCSGVYTRTGSITLQILGYAAPTNVRWKDAGAEILVTFNNYKVTNLSGLTFTYNGTHSITNVTGGLLKTLSSGTSIIHKITANMSVTFDNGKTKTWWVNRLKTWTYPGLGIYQISITGDSAIGGLSNYVTGGVTRAGNSFLVQIPVAMVSNSSCGWYKPTAGIRIVSGIARTLTETFGVTSSGVTYSGASLCGAYGYKFDWTNASGVSRQVVIGY